MKKIKFGSITVARSDFGRMKDFYKMLQESKHDLFLAAGAGHFDREQGYTISDIREEGIETHLEIDFYSDFADLHAEIFKKMNIFFKDIKPDAFIIMGDRHEMLTAALSAVMNRIPIVHIGGGHLTEGAIDEKIRHSITKMSDYHFVHSTLAKERLLKLNEDNNSIFVTGSPDIDSIKNTEIMDKNKLLSELKLNKNEKFILVSVHPETSKGPQENKIFAEEIYNYLDSLDISIIITAPCNDPHKQFFVEACNKLQTKSNVRFVENLGQKKYLSAMKYCEFLLGNSSSGIIESTMFDTYVINLGDRQKNREKSSQVIDCGFSFKEIKASQKLINKRKKNNKKNKKEYLYGRGVFSKKAMDIIEKINFNKKVKAWK